LARAHKGAFRSTRIDDIAAKVLKVLMTRVPGFAASEIEDLIVGCAMPEGEQGYNIARNISFLAGIPLDVAAMTVNRFCASSLEAIHQAALNVQSENGEMFIAGGVETMSHIPIGGFNPSFNKKLMEEGMPDAYISMGATAENLAKHYAISRMDQDRFALASHRKAVAAQSKGAFNEEMVPIDVYGSDGNAYILEYDEGPRSDTSIEALSALRPAFMNEGTVTAGNSSSLTDGVAFAIICSKKYAKRVGSKPLAKIKSCAVAGVDPAVMGLGPVHAVPKALKRAKMKLKDIDLIELNEAFAAQAIAVIGELGLEERRVNVNGGAVALGHPLGATGARIVATLVSAMVKRGAETGLATMCVGGGQGMATILERL
jgi:acetyl-CoA acetyltransferase family protein